MRNFFPSIIFFLGISLTWAQGKSTKEMVEELMDENILMAELTDYAKNNINSDKERARFFYYWISENIQYDYEMLERHNKDGWTEEDVKLNTSPFLVFEKRSAVCAGFSVLYKWFMDEMGIENEVIDGHIRHLTNQTVEPELDTGFSHAWNAIRINNTWLIVDSTWAKQFETNVPDYYFDISPEKLIITHFPSESKWQLLEKPLSLEEFNDSQYIDPLYYLVGFTEEPSLKQDTDFYYFVWKDNPNRNWMVRLGYGTDSINYDPVPGIEVINQDGYTYYKFKKEHIPQKAAFKVDLNNFNQEKQTMVLYENIILFRI
ncbi:transglutaminase domain-containing protein [Maribacter sp. 2-571]|uniref:transglutaminase domain-containing protein n=1 Tax=Maribacter sp. 2-571 TaxID=3417569 RepID=UPI003D32F715